MLLALMLACSPATPAAVAVAGPTMWYYADLGDGMDPDSFAIVDGAPVFRTEGFGLRSGPLGEAGELAQALACDTSTRVVARFQEGVLTDLVGGCDVDPDLLAGLEIEGTPAARWTNLVVVLDAAEAS